jgi:AhpD family alkylhydroperoxidase
MAYHPRLLFGMGAMEMALERSHLVDERLKKLAEVKVAATVGCEFCIDIGSMLGRNLGVTERQLRDLSDYRESAAFSPVEKLVLAYAEAISRTPATVPEGLFEDLREHFDEAALVELTAAISWENHRARFNHAFGLGSQGFSDGAYCPLPEKPSAR